MNLQVHKENLIQVHQKKSVKIALRCQFGKMIHILIHSPSKDVDISKPKSVVDDQKQVQDGLDNENDEKDKSDDDSSPKEVNAAGQHVNTASPDVNIGSFKLNVVDPLVNTASSYDQDNPKDMFTMGASHILEATHVEFFSDEDEPEVDLGNITNSYTVPTTPNIRIHKDHPIKNVIGDVKSFVQTRRMTRPTSEQGFLSVVYVQKTHDTLNIYLYACFLSQIKPTSITKALSDSSWVEAMQEELLQFKLQQVWKLVDLPNGKRAIRTKWVFRNKKDKRGIVIRNKARIKAIRLFLAYASFMGFLVYQMDVKSAFLYGTIEKEVYVTQPQGFKDPNHLEKVYKVVKALYGLHQAPRAWYKTLANYLLGNEFKKGKIDQTLFIKKQKGDILLIQVYVDDIIFGSTNKELLQQKEDGIFISQDKYVVEILKKFNYTDVKSASTLVDLEKPLVKDGDANDVDVYLYRSMNGSLMYLTASRPDIMFAVYSPFELVAYTDSDYARATQDRKSTIGGCQFFGNRLISWQCKKQTVVATSTTKAEYVAAASCYGQVQFRRTSLTGFPAQSIRSSNAIALDSPYLLILITRTSQSRQHDDQVPEEDITGIQGDDEPNRSIIGILFKVKALNPLTVLHQNGLGHKQTDRDKHILLRGLTAPYNILVFFEDQLATFHLSIEAPPEVARIGVFTSPHNQH
ncbi:putative ribonuclease H-like domain-containing protein [Tanacetum coccineum]